ncbi:MAG: IS66 family transposase [Acidobacteria bacterium]|nr:IS66 family transposase [Acidobacteriota bacterium]
MLSREDALAIYRAGPETVVRTLCELSRQVDILQAEVKRLRQRIQTLEDQRAKNSRNSSKPPSSDGFHKPSPRSLREKSERKPGGQPGHPGDTLRMTAHPDRIEAHRVLECERCHRALANRPPEEVERRQVYEAPSKPLVVIEHQAERKRCPCGHLNKAAFPPGVNAPAQYGPGVKARAVYLSQYQLLPYERTCEALGDLFGCGMSEGGLGNLIADCSDRLEGTVREIRQHILRAPVAHFDETGARVEQRRQWLHVASTGRATYYEVHPRRGTEALDHIGLLPQFRGRAIHDFLSAYLKYECAHGLCNAHHLRQLIFLHEQHGQAWAQRMIACLLQIKRAVDQARETSDRLPEPVQRDFEARYQQVLEAGYAENPLPASEALGARKRGRPKKTPSRNLLERLDERRKEVLAFLYDFRVPFDNNLAERDLRMMKLQQKVSGLFRSPEGAHAFCRIRSYLSTARKNALDGLEALDRVWAGHPFVPALNTS